MKSVRIEPADNGYIVYPSEDEASQLGLPHLAKDIDEVHSFISGFFEDDPPEDPLYAFGEMNMNQWDEELA